MQQQTFKEQLSHHFACTGIKENTCQQTTSEIYELLQRSRDTYIRPKKNPCWKQLQMAKNKIDPQWTIVLSALEVIKYAGCNWFYIVTWNTAFFHNLQILSQCLISFYWFCSLCIFTSGEDSGKVQTYLWPTYFTTFFVLHIMQWLIRKHTFNSGLIMQVNLFKISFPEFVLSV